jgi:hypothetical protein
LIIKKIAALSGRFPRPKVTVTASQAQTLKTDRQRLLLAGCMARLGLVSEASIVLSTVSRTLSIQDAAAFAKIAAGIGQMDSLVEHIDSAEDLREVAHPVPAGDAARPIAALPVSTDRALPRTTQAPRGLDQHRVAPAAMDRLARSPRTRAAGQTVAAPASSERPSVTIVVPAYNVQDFVLQTLDSIAHQTFENFECLVIDDGSTDATLSACRERCERDDRFRIIAHRENAGISAARNSGLRAARADLICFLDADDLMMPVGLEMRVVVLRSPPQDLLMGC